MGVILSGMRERTGDWKLADKHAVAVVFIPSEQAKDQFQVEASKCLQMGAATRASAGYKIMYSITSK